jgi:hypothetical protein
VKWLMHNSDQDHGSWGKVFIVWFLAGTAKWGPLEWVQFAAGLIAVLYGSVNLYLAVKKARREK